MEQVKTFIVNGICKKIRKNGTVFLLVVEGHDVGLSKTVFSGSGAKDENAIGNGERALTG